MTHPGDHWTLAAAVALLVWTGVGALTTRHLLRTARRINQASTRHVATLRSTPHRAVRLACYDQIRAGLPGLRRSITRTQRFNDRVHAPVAVALCVPTLVLTLWGIVGHVTGTG